MLNQWNRQTDRKATPTLAIDQAFQIFENEAEERGRNYHGDIVRENLGIELSRGATPQQAVDRLNERAARFHRRGR